MSDVIEYASQSASISEASTSLTDPGSQVLRLSGTASANWRALLDVEIPVPQGEEADVISATLYLTKSSAWSAAADVTIQRTDALWDSATGTWANQPGVRAGSIVHTVPTGGAAGDEIAITVTTLIDAAFTDEDLNDIGYYGLRLSISATGERNFYSAFAAEQAYRPRLEVHYNVPPGEATDLSPSGGLAVSSTAPELFFHPDDDDAEDTISAVRLQIKSGSSDFTTPTYDSGWLSHTEPSFNLASPPTGAPAVPTISAGTNWYWRIAYRDNHAGEADFSDAALFVRVAKGVLTLTAPTAIDSPVPVLTHSLTVETQDEVEVEVERLEDGVWQEHYFLPRHVSVATSHQIPDDYRLEEGYTYRLTKRVWTTVARDDLPGDREFHEVSLTGAF